MTILIIFFSILGLLALYALFLKITSEEVYMYSQKIEKKGYKEKAKEGYDLYNNNNGLPSHLRKEIRFLKDIEYFV